MSNLARHSTILLTFVLATGVYAADEGRFVTQKPEIAQARLKDAAPSQATTQPQAPADLFARGPTPLWIWGDDINKKYYLRKEFDAESSTTWLAATCDNRMTVYLNGQQVASSDAWQEPVMVNVQKHMKPGKNILLAEVENEGGPAGFVLKLVLGDFRRRTRYVVSDESWQAAEKKDAERWVAVKKIAKLGDQPWGNALARGASDTGLPSGVFQTLPGFQVERLFTVPKSQMGSWVSLTVDDKGRLIASDQERLGLYRITPPRIGSQEETRVERLNVKMTAAQGLLYAFGSLYVSANGGPGSGLYRLRSTKGDDQFDEVTKLASIRGGGEHGPHGLRLSPDGKSIFIVCGNHTLPPEKLDHSRVPRNWGEDHLLPRQWDANGHARGILAPGGWIARTDPDGKTWEIYSSGYRNVYDIAFNADGELFAYDADMEWDIGAPWYRPTRVCHATSGSEFGWRSGTGKWPAYYVDSLPAIYDVGPGSPVGVEFGYGTKFPAKYQKALFCLDWTFGTIYAVHLEPDGASYKAIREEFLSRTPLPLTDATVGPDGALYFIVGGRGTQSELFRVTYIGNEPTDKVDYHDARNVGPRELRHQLEKYHELAQDPQKAVEFIYPKLGHESRFIRYAARVALEHQPLGLWQERVLSERDPEKLVSGAVTLARQGNKQSQEKLLEALDRISFKDQPEFRQLELLRTYALVFVRMGEPDKNTAPRLAAKFDAFYPANSDALNRELVQLLVYLKSPTVLSKTLALMAGDKSMKADMPLSSQELLARNRGYGGPIAQMLANGVDLQKFHYAFVLRNVKEGWTLDQRKFFFNFLADARTKSGGASYQGFVNNLEKDAFDNATDVDRLAIEAAGLRKPFKPKALPTAVGPGREWKLDDLVAFAEPKLKGRNYKNGEKMFAAARCIVCHRFNGDGGATGPDLSQVAGRFSLKDLSESIVEPSKVISDQYKASIVETKSGKVYTGKIVNETKDKLIMVIDPEDSTKVVEIKKGDVEEVKPSAVSLMPADLLKTLNENEVLDLLAYLLSRGDPGNAMFRR
jgi:putative heme-binding domain-containing protein